MYAEATGDLFDPTSWKYPEGYEALNELPVDALGHGVNCKGKMGSGIAVPFRQKYPEMYERYAALCAAQILLPGQVFPWATDTHYVFNIASQYEPGADAHIDYLESGLLYCRFFMRHHGLTHLGLPRIGAGIGGLRLDDVRNIIDEIFGETEDVHVTLVSLEGA